MITRIELKNFMSHEHTVIEPASGLTVIAGPNNCGKSAIVTALQILCYNDESTYVTRHGEKECSIKVFTDNGHEVEWIRTKNKSTKYIIDGTQHDRLGRGGTPEALNEILGIRKVNCDNQEFDVHFGSQQNPVFLLNDSPRAAAQFFASSSDAINLIGMQTRHKQKARERQQEKRRIVEELEEKKSKLETLQAVPDVDKRLQDLVSEHQKLKTDDEELIALHNLIMAITEKTLESQRLSECTDALGSLSAPPHLDSTDALDMHVDQIHRLDLEWQQADKISKLLQELGLPPEFMSTTELEQLLVRLENVEVNLGRASAHCKALDLLSSPPKLSETGTLDALLNQLAESQQQFDLAEQRTAACHGLTPLPTLASLEPLEVLLDQIKTGSNELEQIDLQSNELDQKIDTLLVAIDKWIEQNPSCPTCGSQVTSQKLLGAPGACHE